jgi:hypothetical protein
LRPRVPAGRDDSASLEAVGDFRETPLRRNVNDAF